MQVNIRGTNMPLVSFIVPSYNHAEYIQQCISSIIDQDYENIELLVIDDGSSDDSIRLIEEIVDRCKNRFVRFEFRTRPNFGLSSTLNEGLHWANGTYFSALASDDIIFPTKTSRLVESISCEPDVAGVFSGCECIDSSGVKIQEFEYSLVYFNFNEVLKHRHTIQACTQLLRLKNVLEVGGYQAGIYIEDWYMWLKLTEHGYKLKVVPGILAYYRVHDSNSSNNRLKMFESRLQVLNYFRHHSLYTDTVSEMYVWASRDFCYVSTKKSIAFLLKSLSCNKKVLVHLYFYVAILGLITPAWLAKHISFFIKRFPNID